MILEFSPRSVAEEVRAIVRGLTRPGEPLKTALARISRETGISERRLRAFAHAEAQRIEAHERDALRAQRLRDLEDQLRRTQHELAVARMRWGALQDDLALDREGGRRVGERVRLAG